MKKPYKTSKDYKLLWDLISEPNYHIICAYVFDEGFTRLCQVHYEKYSTYQIFYVGKSFTSHKGLEGYTEYETFVLDCEDCDLEFILPNIEPEKQEKTYTFGLSVTKKDPNPNAKKYNIETITDLYRTVTPENVERLAKDIVEILHIYAYQKQVLEIDTSDVTASFEWTDD